MRVLLTGGAGDLGTILAKALEERGDMPLRFDIVPPVDPWGTHLAGSILDRARLAQVLDGVDCVVHIAAWHGIHEANQMKDAYAFWDLNVTGTFNVFEAAVQAGIRKCLYISSTSVRHALSLYGHTKVLGETIAHTYAARHGMQVVTLRPRGFIPHWNRAVYTSFIDWAQWFWRGAVHIDDVAQAALQSIDLLTTTLEQDLVLVVDRAYTYTDEDLRTWDHAGPGSTFAKYYAAYRDLAVQYGLRPEDKPFPHDIAETQRCLGYTPRYGLKHLLEELAQYGPAGPPSPLDLLEGKHKGTNI